MVIGGRWAYDSGLKNVNADTHFKKIHTSNAPIDCTKQFPGVIAISSIASLALFVPA